MYWKSTRSKRKIKSDLVAVSQGAHTTVGVLLPGHTQVSRSFVATVSLFLLQLFPLDANGASALEYGQDLSCSHVAPLPATQGSPDVVVYHNRTAVNVAVTGDLIVKKTRCPVQVIFGPAAPDTFTVEAPTKEEPALENIFYISFNTRAGWLYPALNRLNQTSSAVLRKRYSEHWHGKESELGKLALVVEAKLSKLPIVVAAVDKDIRLLEDELKARKSEVDECIARQSSLSLRREELGLSLSANRESFLYHARSTYESIRRFLIKFSRTILEKSLTEADIRDILERESIATEWRSMC